MYSYLALKVFIFVVSCNVAYTLLIINPQNVFQCSEL